MVLIEIKPSVIEDEAGLCQLPPMVVTMDSDIPPGYKKLYTEFAAREGITIGEVASALKIGSQAEMGRK